MSADTGEISDGCHTFNELYDHRSALFIAFLKSCADDFCPWMSRCHHDGSSYDGWFIAGVNLPTGDITYHLSDKYWDILKGAGVSVLEKGKEWDGHTSKNVYERILEYVQKY